MCYRLAMRNQTEARRAAYERQRRVPRPEYVGDGLCLCGCGRRTAIATVSSTRDGTVKGHPRRYLPSHHLRGMKRGEGRYTNSQGYVLLRKPDHPGAHKGYVLEHRWVMEQVLGRPLRPDEPVHHLNHVRTDNRPENLAVLSQHEHGKQHGRPRQPRRLCEIPGCGRVHYGRGYCLMHYDRWRTHGSVELQIPVRAYPWRGCTVPGCDRRHLAKDLCARHYALAWRAAKG